MYFFSLNICNQKFLKRLDVSFDKLDFFMYALLKIYIPHSEKKIFELQETQSQV